MIWKPHVTVATIVCKEKQFLMVEEDIRGKSELNQPAGHLESGESLLEAACRETFEETAYRIQLVHLIGIYQWTSPLSHKEFIRFCFSGEVISHVPEQPLDSGIIAAHWFSHEQILERSAQLRSPMIIQSIGDYLSGITYPLSLVQWMNP